MTKETLKATAKQYAEVAAPQILLKADTSQLALNQPAQAEDEKPDPKPPTTIELKDKDGKPLAHQRFAIDLADGGRVSGMLDENGKAELQLDTDISGEIRFPDVEDQAPA